MPEAIPNPAEIAAAAAQARVTSSLNDGKHFRLEAGAGAGKTYSLVAALKRLIDARGAVYLQKNQKVACITYTKVARDEILKEIDQHPAIAVDTIHGFCWGFMSRFQARLRELVPQIARNTVKINDAGGVGGRRVEYDLGFFGINDDAITLSHDDIPALMAMLMNSEKFRKLFTNSYPVLFIDEYQDTDQAFLNAISAHWFQNGDGPLVGLFGDHWQSIYNEDFDLAVYPNVEAIDKGANFRSVPPIVSVLNNLRPELPQAVRDPGAVGMAIAFHCNDYVGPRTATAHSRNDLFPAEAQKYLASVKASLEASGWDFAVEKTKILMLTHNTLAAEQGYPTIDEIFKKRRDAYVKKEDKTIEFLVDIVEPMSRAYQNRSYGDMFRLLGKPQTVRNTAEKIAWRDAMTTLANLRLNATVGDVLDHLKASARPRLPDPVAKRETDLANYVPAADIEEPAAIQRQRALRLVLYKEVIELAKFIEGSTPFATQHSVKGAEFENVLVVCGGGWNKYNWPQMLALLGAGVIPAANRAGFYRARNLFYVSLSRPKKRLAALFTQTMPPEALDTLNRLFGAANVRSVVV
jgi:DNA helicase-2/ATP-dependent DNA helicase PcrA